MSINKVILIGNLGHAPEVRYTQNGVPVATFTMATSEHWKDDAGNKQSSTEWHRIVAWRKAAENCAEYLKKGSKVYIEGKLRTRKWKDKNNVDRYTTEIHVSDIKFLSTNRDNEYRSPEPTPARGNNETLPEPPMMGEDVPF